MSKFPIINHLNDLLPHIQDNPQFRVAPQPNGTTVVCYMLQDEDTFTGANEEHAKECRGITFHSDGSVASRTLHKFKNVGESEETKPDLIPWDRVVRVLSKLDGSMITPVLFADGSIGCKTKKTFTSNEAIAATEYLNRDRRKFEHVREWLRAGFTPTFEWTSPRFPIVLTYEQDELTLLHIRKNDTGEYLLKAIDRIMPPLFPFSIVPNLRDKFKDPRELLELAKTAEGIEGWVIQTDDGEMYKIKTAWYVQLHKTCSFLRERDVVEMVLDDKFDDLLGAFALTGRTAEAEKAKRIRREVLDRVANIQQQVSEVVTAGQGLTPKDMALQHQGHELFGLIMSSFRGKEVDYYDWFKKQFLHTYTLNVLSSMSE
jgi:T4 RnlA family RNA ligase